MVIWDVILHPDWNNRARLDVRFQAMWLTPSTLAALLVSTAGAARADDLVASGDDHALFIERISRDKIETVYQEPSTEGPLSLTAVMTRLGDRKIVRRELDPVDVVLPRELGLMCTHGLVLSDCGLQPLPVDQAVVRPIARIGASETTAPRTMTINGRPLASVISKLGTVSLSELFPAARREDGSLAPGHYTVTLIFHQLHRTWDLLVE